MGSLPVLLVGVAANEQDSLATRFRGSKPFQFPYYQSTRVVRQSCWWTVTSKTRCPLWGSSIPSAFR